MVECEHCGKDIDLPFKCKFCGETYCDEHRLPENHDCLGLEEYKERSKEKTEVVYEPFQKKGKEENVNSRSFTFSVAGSFFSSGGIYLKIIIACIFVYLLQFLVPMLTGFAFTEMFYIEPVFGEIVSRPWTLLTSIFLHSTEFPLHIFANMLVLFFFGGELERRIGSKKFLELYLVSGIVANLGFWFYSSLTGSATAALGASGAIFGVFAALAIIAPEIRVLVWFVLPLKIRHALIIFALWDLFLLPYGGPVASSAHLAGVVVGLIYGYKIGRKSRRLNIGIS